MKLERLMKEYYRRELAGRRLPGETGGGEGERVAAPRRQEPLWMHLVFNGAAAAVLVLALVGHHFYRSPLAGALTTVNQKYGIDAAVLRELDRLPGSLNRHY